MEDIFGQISNATMATAHQKIWDEVIKRLTWIANGSWLSGNLLKLDSETIWIPPQRPSGSGYSWSKHHLGIDSNFSDPVPLIQSYKLTQGTRLYKIAGLSLALFEEANKVGAEVLDYAKSLDAKLRKEFGIKFTGEFGIDTVKEEHADYPRLAIFICERQWLFSTNGLTLVKGVIQPDVPQSAHIMHGTYIVWSGPLANAEKRLLFVDALLTDNKKALKILEKIKPLKTAAEALGHGKNGLQMALNKADASEGKDVELDPTKLCYTALCHTLYFGGKTWKFHNGAKVVRVLIDAHQRGLEDIHIDEIEAALPSALHGLPLSQIFKSSAKDATWKDLVVAGHGKGFYRINPAYLENGIKEIRLGVPGTLKS